MTNHETRLRRLIRTTIGNAKGPLLPLPVYTFDLLADALEKALAPLMADGITRRIAPMQAYYVEKKDTSVGSQPTGAASTARAEIRAVLLAVGYNQPAADELMKRADREPHAQPDDEFAATLAGGHALIVEDADIERYGACQCGKRFGTISPHISPNAFVPSWQLHLIEVDRG